MPLEQIILQARQEAHRMSHYYLGVEHLLIALLEIRGSAIGGILEEHGLSPDYVINAIRRKIGKGGKQRFFPVNPRSPRAQATLDRAEKIAAEQGKTEADERDLLLSILREADSMPVQVLVALGLNIDQIRDGVRDHKTALNNQPYLRIEYADDFPEEHKPDAHRQIVLRRLFPGYLRIRLERCLFGGYTKASLYIVTPIHADNRHDAAVVVKIDASDVILDEVQRYEQHVKNTLPPMTARIEDRPATPENSPLAGIKYTLIAEGDNIPYDLRALIREWRPEELGAFLHKLYTTFGPLWWGQSRQYRFPAWREYDWVLPPILIADRIESDQIPLNAHTLRFPLKRGRLHNIESGDVVIIENFTVRKIDPEAKTIQLAVGLNTATEMAYKIMLRSVNVDEDTHYRGEIVERIAGRVWQTRDEQLLEALRHLQPDFNPSAETIEVQLHGVSHIPNPLQQYEGLLDILVNGLAGKIHGDMHLGNIMVGPGRNAFLIDFGRAREGHALFDWVSLEISILRELVMPNAGESWDDARRVLRYLHMINQGRPLPEGDENTPAFVQHLRAIVEVRRIAQQCMASPDNWMEYFVVLALCGLRALKWNYMPTPARRLMFLVSGLAMYELRQTSRSGPIDLHATDETDIHPDFLN